MISAEAGSLLVGVAALLTAIYAVWGGRVKNRNQNMLSLSDIEGKLRTALYSDFQKQREENDKLKKRIKAMEEEIGTLEQTNAEQQEEINVLRTELDEQRILVDTYKREVDRLKSDDRPRNPPFKRR